MPSDIEHDSWLVVMLAPEGNVHKFNFPIVRERKKLIIRALINQDVIGTIFHSISSRFGTLRGNGFSLSTLANYGLGYWVAVWSE